MVSPFGDDITATLTSERNQNIKDVKVCRNYALDLAKLGGGGGGLLGCRNWGWRGASETR